MSIENRINKLFEAIGDGKLFGGAPMESLAKHGFLTRRPDWQSRAPRNVRKLAAFSALRLRWIKLTRDRYADERSTILEKLDLQPYATLEEARDRIIEIGHELEFNPAEMAKLEQGLKMSSANVA
jgi:hypothetical protein